MSNPATSTPWANGAPLHVVQRAVKDFQFYEGLAIEPSDANIAPDGWTGLQDAVAVVVCFSFIEFNYPYVDAMWKVEFSPLTKAAILKEQPELKDVDLDSYVRGFSYLLDQDNQIIDCYRAWRG